MSNNVRRIQVIPDEVIEHQDAVYSTTMATASHGLSHALNLSRGLVWPCGHERSWRTTQTVAGEQRCRECRRKRWLSRFYMLASSRMSAQLSQRRIDQLANARAVAASKQEQSVKSNITHPKNGKIPLSDLIREVCIAFNLSQEELLGNGRCGHLIDARSVIIKILHDRKASYPAIARLVGRKCHTTIINSIKQFNYYRTRNPLVDETYEKLRDRRVADAR